MITEKLSLPYPNCSFFYRTSDIDFLSLCVESVEAILNALGYLGEYQKYPEIEVKLSVEVPENPENWVVASFEVPEDAENFCCFLYSSDGKKFHEAIVHERLLDYMSRKGIPLTDPKQKYEYYIQVKPINQKPN